MSKGQGVPAGISATSGLLAQEVQTPVALAGRTLVEDGPLREPSSRPGEQKMSKFWSGVRRAVRVSLTKAEAVRDGPSRVIHVTPLGRSLNYLGLKCFAFGR